MTLTQSLPPTPHERRCTRRLRDEVERALRDSPLRVWGPLEVLEHGGDVTLRGRVDGFHAKQMARVVALQVAGVDRVHNEIEVCWPE